MTTDVVKFVNKTLDHEFRFSILGYKYPDETTGTDANWLFVRTECYSKGLEFTSESTSLFTREIMGISEWFDAASKNQIPRFTTLCFLEPNIQFALGASHDGMIRFSIELSQESKPPFQMGGLVVDTLDPAIMVFEYSFEEMKQFGNKFRKFYGAYPQRGSCFKFQEPPA